MAKLIRATFYVVALLLAATGGALLFRNFGETIEEWLRGKQSPRPTPAVVSIDPLTQPCPPEHPISALGRLRTKGGLINVGGLTGDRLTLLTVEVGDFVEQGQPDQFVDEVLDLLTEQGASNLTATEKERLRGYGLIGALGSTSLRQAELKYALAQRSDTQRQAELAYQAGMEKLQEAEFQVKNAGKSQLRERDIQTGRLRILERSKEVAQSNYDRLLAANELTSDDEEPLVSDQQIEQALYLVDKADRELDAAKLMIESLAKAADIEQQAAQLQLKTAQANLESVKAARSSDALDTSVDLARERLHQTLIWAPRGGQVLDIFTQQGEIIGPSPIVRLGDTRQLQVVAEVYETGVRCLKEGLDAQVDSRALGLPAGETLPGKVTRIGQTIAQQQVMGIGGAAPTDTRVVEVVIDLEMNRIDEHLRVLLQRMVHLQVDVKILFQSPEDVAPEPTEPATQPEPAVQPESEQTSEEPTAR